MVYGMALWAWHGIWYGMAWRGLALYRIRPGEVWHGMWKCLYEFHVLWHCLGLWSRSHVEKPMSVGDPVHTYRTHSRIEGPSHACSFHMHSSWSLWAVTVNWEIMNIYITVLGYKSRQSQLLCAKRTPSFLWKLVLVIIYQTFKMCLWKRFEKHWFSQSASKTKPCPWKRNFLMDTCASKLCSEHIARYMTLLAFFLKFQFRIIQIN